VASSWIYIGIGGRGQCGGRERGDRKKTAKIGMKGKKGLIGRKGKKGKRR